MCTEKTIAHNPFCYFYKSTMIKVQNLSYTYPGSQSPVLNNISFTIPAGQFVVIMGANGSGKSTLLRCLNGLIQPNHGHVYIDDLSVQEPQHLPNVRQKVGMVFQNPDDQIIASTVEREIAFGLENQGIPQPEMHQRVARMLDQFQLVKYHKQDPNQLSGGERQRLALASIIVMTPKYLLLDEPTSLLDPGARQNILADIYHLHQETETTPILVTQIPSEAIRADRIIVLSQGQIALDAPPADIFAQTDTLTQLGLHSPLASQIAQKIHLSKPYPLTIQDLANRIHIPPFQKDTLTPTHKNPTQPIIRAHQLSHLYNPKLPNQIKGLDNLNIEISAGEISVFIGPSGSGKSTFVQHLNGLLTPTTGSLTVCDRNPNRSQDLIDLRRFVGLIFQFPEAQLFAETVFDDVAFGPQNLKMSDIATHVHTALQDVGLDPNTFIKRDPLRLSGGEKRRVAIAGILAMSPNIIVFDEPTAGLDPQGAQRIESLIHTQKEQGRTVVMITHDLDLAARVADHIYLFQSGQVIKHGTPAEILTTEILHPLNLQPPEIVQLVEILRKKNGAIPDTCITPQGFIDFFNGNSP